MTAKAMWPMETTGQCKASAPSEYGSQAVNDEQVKTFLCSPGSILVSGMGQTKCFLGMNNEITKHFCTLDGSPPTQSLFSQGQTDRPL